MSDDFNDILHKDSFVRGKPEGEKGKGKPPEKKQLPAIPKKKENLDDFVPNSVGKMVDNVFGKLDNLVNDAADYLFSGNPAKKGGGLMQQDSFARQAPPPMLPKQDSFSTPAPKVPAIPAAPPPSAVHPASLTPVQQPPAPISKPIASPPPAPKTNTIRQLSTLQSRKPELIKPVMPESKAHILGPVVARTTPISELDLPLEILDDPDLPRYFDQMKLYEVQAVDGGLCNMSQYEATVTLKRGLWKNHFKIKFEDLKHIEPGIYPMEMAKSRFNGMRPVYKAMAGRFSNQQTLVKAIEDDINLYLRTGKGSKKFHKFVYQVVAKAY